MGTIRFINTGKKPDDGKGDRIVDAAKKINHNFDILFQKFRINEPFRIIVWEDISDTRKAMDDVNYNFKIIEDHLSC